MLNVCLFHPEPCCFVDTLSSSPTHPSIYLQAYFSCNGEALAKSSQYSELDSVDSLGRVRRVLVVQISREQVHHLLSLTPGPWPRWRSTLESSGASVTPGPAWV